MSHPGASNSRSLAKRNVAQASRIGRMAGLSKAPGAPCRSAASVRRCSPARNIPRGDSRPVGARNRPRVPKRAALGAALQVRTWLRGGLYSLQLVCAVTDCRRHLAIEACHASLGSGRQTGARSAVFSVQHPGLAITAGAVAVGHLPVAYRAAGGCGHVRAGVS